MAKPFIPNAYDLTSGKIVGAILGGLQMAVKAKEKLASQIDPDVTDWDKFVSEIGRVFWPARHCGPVRPTSPHLSYIYP